MSDEDKSDFELLQRRLSSQSVASTIPDVWPLHLSAVSLEHYIFGNQIGSGSYAEVRECINTITLERCAVKIVNKDYLKRRAPNALANQEQEIRLLHKLSHQNIISMRECIFRAPKIYIFLEYCQFLLHDLIFEHKAREKHLSLMMTRNLFRQLATGIGYLHSRGVVHRDVKPQNLLITTDGILKIIDFGVSHMLSIWSGSDLCSNHEGSPLFQAPEVVVGQKQYAGFKVDIWSAGVTLFLMLYGEYPFMDESLLGLYDRILGQEFEIPKVADGIDNTRTASEINNDIEARSPVVVDLLALMLDKDHSRRAPIDEILAHPWLKLSETLNGDEHSEYIGISKPIRQEAVTTDIYKSMSVLPYLHSYHFPYLSATQHSQADSTVSSSSSPHEIIDEQSIQWGTEEQYKLLKVPQIRTNRKRGRNSSEAASR